MHFYYVSNCRARSSWAQIWLVGLAPDKKQAGQWTKPCQEDIRQLISCHISCESETSNQAAKPVAKRHNACDKLQACQTGHLRPEHIAHLPSAKKVALSCVVIIRKDVCIPVKCVAYTWHITTSFHVPMPFGLFATILGWEGHIEPEATYRDTRDGKVRLAYLVWRILQFGSYYEYLSATWSASATQFRLVAEQGWLHDLLSPMEQSTTTATNDVTKDNFIPLFNNKIADYREWRLRIGLYHRKMVLQNKKKEATINLLTSLNGLAWRQIEHTADKLVDDDDGFSKALQILDACFKYNEKVEMPRAFEKFFFNLTRQPTQTLLSYTTEHREHLREIEKFGVKIPTAVSGWLMLRRAGLTVEQRQLVQTHVGATMDELKIEEAMFLLFGQDYRRTSNEPSRGFRGKSTSTGAPRWSSRRGHSAYIAMDGTTGDDDGDYDHDEIYATEEYEARTMTSLMKRPVSLGRPRTCTGKKIGPRMLTMSTLEKMLLMMTMRKSMPRTWMPVADLQIWEQHGAFGPWWQFLPLHPLRALWHPSHLPRDSRPKARGRVEKEKEKVREGRNLSIRMVQHPNVHPQLLQFAFDVVRPAITVTVAPIHPASPQHPLDPNHLEREPKLLKPMPTWWPPMLTPASLKVSMPLWTMEPEVS